MSRCNFDGWSDVIGDQSESEWIASTGGSCRRTAIRPRPPLPATSNDTCSRIHHVNIIKYSKDTKYLSGKSAHDRHNAFSFKTPHYSLAPPRWPWQCFCILQWLSTPDCQVLTPLTQFSSSRSVPKIFAVKSLNLFEIAPNFACFGPIFLGEEGPASDSGTWIIKLNVLPITWQSFTSIGRGSSEISRWKKKQTNISSNTYDRWEPPFRAA